MEKGFFDMTRHERRGTIAVLALIALLLIATLAVRSCRPETPVTVQAEAVQQFDAATDTVQPPVRGHAKRDKQAAKPHSPKKKKHDNRPRKPAPAPRPVDPVPQF